MKKRKISRSVWVRKRTAFSLVELVIVVVILTILLGIATMNYIDISQKSKDAVAKSNLRTMKSAVLVYQVDHKGDYPTPEDPVDEDFPGNVKPDPEKSAQLTGLRPIIKYLEYHTYTQPGKDYHFVMRMNPNLGGTVQILELIATGGGLPDDMNVEEWKNLFTFKKK